MRSMARGFLTNRPAICSSNPHSPAPSSGRPLKGEVQLAVGRRAAAEGDGEGVRPRRPRRNITSSGQPALSRAFVRAQSAPSAAPPGRGAPPPAIFPKTLDSIPDW